jgi:hypothetical protein
LVSLKGLLTANFWLEILAGEGLPIGGLPCCGLDWLILGLEKISTPGTGGDVTGRPSPGLLKISVPGGGGVLSLRKRSATWMGGGVAVAASWLVSSQPVGEVVPNRVERERARTLFQKELVRMTRKAARAASHHHLIRMIDLTKKKREEGKEKI